VFAPASTTLTAETRTWLVDPTGKELGGAGFYSLLQVRPGPTGGYDFYHSGSWGYRSSPTSPSGAINDSIGTRAMRAASGTSWFVSFEPRPAPSAREALDRALYRAALR
jgi:hypothetical protein